MPEFRVWAPKPALVRLDVNGAVHAMTRSADGWWHTTVAAPADARYGYLLDDDPTVLPDPRSARQPDGVHARSQRWEPPGQFGAARTDTGWPGRSVEGAVIYELHIGTFTTAGTFDAAIEKLDYLVDLGIDFVELMPVNSFAGTRGWGYDGVLWYSVHEPYGGPDGLVRFIDACHARRLGVLIDAVFNHLGPSGNYLPRFGPYLSSASNPWGDGINIAGADSDEVRHYIIDCALRWMRDFHADGLRLDAVHALVDTTAVHVLEELANATRWLSGQLGRPLSLIAETDRNDPRLITRPSHGGYGITAQWNDDIHHAFYRDLIALRHNEADLADPWLDHLMVDYDEQQRWVVMRRGQLMIACNLGAEPTCVPVSGELVLAWESPIIGDNSTELAAYSLAILRAAEPA